MSKKIKKLGYGVGVHYNEFRDVFEVYKLGTYYPSDSNLNKDEQVVAINKKLNKAIKLYIRSTNF
jgi:hypothetical protein